MKIAIIGSRTFNDAALFNIALKQIMEISCQNPTIISGGAKGADTFAAEFAKHHNYPLIIFKPDWKSFGKGAGLVRNTEIINAADIVVAFWDGKSKGTLDSINKAKKMNKVVHVISINIEQ